MHAIFVQVGRIPFNQQIKNFESTLDQITDNLGADAVADTIAHCIFFVGMGSNDYLNNYLMPNYNTRNEYNGEQFADLLVQQYSRQLTVSCCCIAFYLLLVLFLSDAKLKLCTWNQFSRTKLNFERKNLSQ